MHIIWTPRGDDVFELEHAPSRMTLRARRKSGEGWIGSTRLTGSPPSDMHEFHNCETRREAMDWCLSRVEPEVPSSEIMHLIGDGAGAVGSSTGRSGVHADATRQSAVGGAR